MAKRRSDPLVKAATNVLHVWRKGEDVTDAMHIMEDVLALYDDCTRQLGNKNVKAKGST